MLNIEDPNAKPVETGRIIPLNLKAAEFLTIRDNHSPDKPSFYVLHCEAFQDGMVVSADTYDAFLRHANTMNFETHLATEVEPDMVGRLNLPYKRRDELIKAVQASYAR